MCKPTSEGGQRCAAHTRKAVSKAQTAYANANARFQFSSSANPDKYQAALTARRDAHQAWIVAQIEHASTTAGRAEYAAELRAAQTNLSAFHIEKFTDLLAKGDALRERNQAVAAAVKTATVKKAAAAPKPTPSEVTLDQIEPGDTFYWDGDNHVLEDFRTDPDDPDMWAVETATMNLSIPKSDTVEPVEDEPFIGETDAERFAAIRDEEAQVSGSAFKPTAVAPAIPKAVKLTEEQFENEYEPILQSDDVEGENAYWDNPPTGYPTNQTWTVVEGDANENHYAVPGIRHINVLGYIASKKPWTDPNIEVLYFDHVNLMDKD